MKSARRTNKERAYSLSEGGRSADFSPPQGPPWRAFRMLLRTKGRSPAPVPPSLRGHECAGFTLAEVLAALLFMAIVVPVAIEGLHIASLAGAVAAAKGQAARVGEDMLNQNLVSTNWTQTLQGTVSEGQRTFRWSLTSDPWTEDPSQAVMRQLSVTVNYTVRGRDYSIRLSTLVDSSLAMGVPTGSTK